MTAAQIAILVIVAVFISFLAGGVVFWVVYRSGRDDEAEDRDRWERADYGLTDTAPTIVPEPRPTVRTYMGTYTPTRKKPRQHWLTRRARAHGGRLA